MELILRRAYPMQFGTFTADNEPPPATTGDFYVDGERKYFSIEEPHGSPLEIPAGRYSVLPYKSPRFQDLLRQLAQDSLAMRGINWVPRLFSDTIVRRLPVEIHVANYVADPMRNFVGVEGCVGLGMIRQADGRSILQSRNAIEDFYPQLNELGAEFPSSDGLTGLFQEPVWLDVVD